MLLRLGEQFVPASYPANLDPAFFRRVTRHQLIQRSLHRQLFLAERLSQLLDRRRLIRRINYRFQRRFSLFVSHMDLLCSGRSLDRFFSGSFLVLFFFFSVPSASSVSSVLISCLFFQLSTFNF